MLLTNEPYCKVLSIKLTPDFRNVVYHSFYKNIKQQKNFFNINNHLNNNHGHNNVEIANEDHNNIAIANDCDWSILTSVEKSSSSHTLFMKLQQR